MDGSSATIGVRPVTPEEILAIREGSPEEAAAALTKILEGVHYIAVMHALMGFPDTIRLLFKNTVEINKMRDKFYAEHPELKDRQQEVVMAMARVEADNPGWKYEQILEGAAKQVQQETAAANLAARKPADQTRPEPEKINHFFKGVLNGPTESESGGPDGCSGD